MRHGTRRLSGERTRHGAWCPATGLLLRRRVAGFVSAVDSIGPIELWVKYNRRLLQYIAAHDIPLVNFDWTADVYGKAVDHLADRIGVSTDAPAENPFYEQGLRTSDLDKGLPQSMGPRVHEIYEELLDRAMPVSTFV